MNAGVGPPMPELAKCKTWFDQTWWEVETPASWTFRLDTSISGSPGLFESPAGARFWIAASKQVRIDGWDFSIAPKNTSLEQQKAFLLAADEASSSEIPPPDISKMSPMDLAMLQHELVLGTNARRAAAASRLHRHDVGELVGFTFETKKDAKSGWIGYFSHDPWMLRATFLSPSQGDADSKTALSVLGTLRFRGPNK